MSRVSPTLEAFRAAFRRPLWTMGEITWRWVVGATATVLLFFGLVEFLDTLPVTTGETLLLRTRNPFLVSQALAHIFHGSITRGVLSLSLAVMLLALTWIIAASLGRIATVEAMLEHFRMQFAGFASKEEDSARIRPNGGRFLPLVRLNFLRVGVILAAVIGFAGAAFLGGFTSSPTHPRPGLAFLVFVPIASVVCLIAYELNWLLSLAAVFVVRDGVDAVPSIASAVDLCRQKTGAVFAVSSWTGVAHLIAFVGATTIVSVPLALVGAFPWRVVAWLMILVTLAYFALADWLYTVRLAGYVCIAEMPDALLAPLPPIVPAPPIPSQTIDRDELILSDVPIPEFGG